MVGWYTTENEEKCITCKNDKNSKIIMSCFYGEKIDDNINKNNNIEEDVLLRNSPNEKILTDEYLKEIKVRDLQKYINKINNANLTWKAKINPKYLNMSILEYKKLLFNSETTNLFSKTSNIFDNIIKTRNLEQTQNDPKINNFTEKDEDSHYVTSPEEILKYINKSLDEIDENTLPKNWDWRDVGGQDFYSEPEIQGTCGSCYILSSISILESRLRIKTLNKDKTKFSTQFPLSCSFYTEGCKGGFPIVLGKFFHDFEIIPEMNCLQYSRYETNCNETCDFKTNLLKYFVNDYGYIGGFYGAANEVLMMKELRARGPITGNILTPFLFSFYDGGIYSENGLKESDGFSYSTLVEQNIFYQKVSHSTIIVGYGEENGVKYWICRNTWGNDWAENGYFRVVRGENAMCVESMPEFMNIDYEERF